MLLQKEDSHIPCCIFFRINTVAKILQKIQTQLYCTVRFISILKYHAFHNYSPDLFVTGQSLQRMYDFFFSLFAFP